MWVKYNEDKYQFIDNKVNLFFKNKMLDLILNILICMWRDECLYEEQKLI